MRSGLFATTKTSQSEAAPSPVLSGAPPLAHFKSRLPPRAALPKPAEVDLSRIPVTSASPFDHPERRLRLPLRAMLEIGPVDDPWERDAEQTAERVMRMPDPITPTMSRADRKLRRCAACEKEKEQEKEQKTLARTASSSAPALAGETAPPIVHDTLRSPGRSLDTSTRAFFEPRFGHDFSRVRVHTDVRAAESARSVRALAYTVGPNIVFASNQFSEHTSAGRRLLAHELTHTVQQGAATRAKGEMPPSATSFASHPRVQRQGEPGVHDTPAGAIPTRTRSRPSMSKGCTGAWAILNPQTRCGDAVRGTAKRS